MVKMKDKTLKSNLITYGIVIAAYIVVQILLTTGNLSSLFKGLLVPLCVYVILAVSLNLVVGISGELSLGHAGFMCVGAFSSAFFSKCVQDTITVSGLRFFLAVLVGAAVAAVFGVLIGIFPALFFFYACFATFPPPDMEPPSTGSLVGLWVIFAIAIAMLLYLTTRPIPQDGSKASPPPVNKPKQ